MAKHFGGVFSWLMTVFFQLWIDTNLIISVKKTLALTCQQNEPGTLNLALWISAFLTKIHLYRMFKHPTTTASRE